MLEPRVRTSGGLTQADSHVARGGSPWNGLDSAEIRTLDSCNINIHNMFISIIMMMIIMITIPRTADSHRADSPHGPQCWAPPKSGLDSYNNKYYIYIYTLIILFYSILLYYIILYYII